MATAMLSDAVLEEEAAPASPSRRKLASIERALPSLSDIDDREVAQALVQVTTIQARATALQQGLVGRLVTLRAQAPARAEEDRWVRIEQAAEMLGTSKDWLYRHWQTLGFAVRHGGHIAFSRKGLSDYMKRRIQARRAS